MAVTPYTLACCPVVTDCWVFSGCFWTGEESTPEHAGVCVFPQDAKFVEERRKQLQNYLRSVMNKVIQVAPEFAASPKKETLVQLMPFFV